MHRAGRRQLEARRQRLELQIGRLRGGDPRQRLGLHAATLRGLEHRLQSALARQLQTENARLAQAERALQGLSPLAVLGRGYALVRTDDGQLVRSPQQVQAGMGLEVQVADGRFPVTATSRRP